MLSHDAVLTPLCYYSMASRDVRVRVRPVVVRVRISETAIRAVIRITAPQDQLILLYLPLTPVGFTIREL